ncbi:MAG TPA: VanZ family protein, partial [Pseudonocardiaceae bacterium]|nr:VanZ family protein [Pseudonocardiaceae bacterium]
MSDGPDLNPHNLLNILLHHLEVPAAFIPGAIVLGGLAWWLAPRRGWAQVPAMLAGCALALVLALTVVRPFGHFSVGGLNPLTTLRECSVGSLSLAHLYEQLNVAMLVPFGILGMLATRRPWLIVASSVLVSGFAEFVQGATGGGECQVRDLVHNTVGGVLGVLLAVWILRLRARQSSGITEELGVGA